MSDALQNSRRATASDVEMRASLWLEQRAFGDWDKCAEDALNDWLSQSWENRVAFWRLDAAWNRTERLAALRHRAASDGQQTAQYQPRLHMLMGIAAGFAAMAMLGLVAAHLLAQPGQKTYATAVGGHEIIKFADGTRIELNTNTVLRTRMTTAERTVWLDRGEAYFDVRHDAAHPFKVITGKNVVTDLGTKFSIRRDGSHLEVALLDGRVRFGTASGAVQSVLLTPGDTVTATADSIFVAKKPIATIADALSWRQGVLDFDNALLSGVAEEFNRYNHEKIAVIDPAAASVRITGTFRTDNADAFIGTVQRVFQLHVRKDGETVTISR
jgi:transmembrane sensor